MSYTQVNKETQLNHWPKNVTENKIVVVQSLLKSATTVSQKVTSDFLYASRCCWNKAFELSAHPPKPYLVANRTHLFAVCSVDAKIYISE